MEKNYLERQAKWIAENNVKIGDRVKVLRSAQSREKGWDNSWNPLMDLCVDKIGEIVEIYKDVGIRLKYEHQANQFYFPYFVLEKVSDELTKDMSHMTFLFKNGETLNFVGKKLDREYSSWIYKGIEGELYAINENEIVYCKAGNIK